MCERVEQAKLVVVRLLRFGWCEKTQSSVIWGQARDELVAQSK